MKCPSARILLASAALLWLPTAALAQSAPELPPPTVIEIRPAAAPVPAMKYRIVPERRALVPGNAAIFYHRAIEMVLERRRVTAAEARNRKEASPAPSEGSLFRWINGPIREIPRDQARAMLRTYASALHEVELGARRRECDWEFDLRDEGFDLLLPEMNEMRSLGRLVALRARVAVLDGETDEAFRWIQIGVVMSRHISQGTSMIQAMVGCVTEGMVARALEDLIQAPGTPSLYWALAARPRPLIDLTDPLEGEYVMIEHELPILREADDGPWTLEKARQTGDDLRQKLRRLTGAWFLASGAGEGEIDSAPPTLRDVPPRLAMAAMVAKVYPEARRALIARGRPAAEVEAMPALQVALIFTIRAYHQFLDDVFKWTCLPYWQSHEEVDRALTRASSPWKGENPILELMTRLIPPIHSARLASVRGDRQLDAFQCIEAIRLHAEAHDGKLPPSLEAIEEAPAPVDPATGKPFEYKVSGDSATLEAPLPPGAPEHPSYRIRYELKLSR